MFAKSHVRMVTAGHDLEPRDRYIRAIAIGAHEELCGSWEAAGYDTKFEFVNAAERMLVTLEERGLDLFSFPGDGWRTSYQDRDPAMSPEDGWKAAAGLSADLSSFGRVLEEIAEFIESRHKEGDTDYQAALIARRVLNGDSYQDTRGGA